MQNYEWAVNRRKLEISVADLKTAGVEITEQALKAQYVKRGGLLQQELPGIIPSNSELSPETTEESTEETPVVSDEAPKPKAKRGRKPLVVTE